VPQARPRLQTALGENLAGGIQTVDWERHETQRGEYPPKVDSQQILTFYMGKNTPERKDYIMEKPGGAGGGVTCKARNSGKGNLRTITLDRPYAGLKTVVQ
jgi:hypothetical protein